MFKPILTQYYDWPTSMLSPLESAAASQICETESDAEERARQRTQEGACCMVPLTQKEGGVDVAAVLHWVKACEVHACVEANLTAEAARPIGKGLPDDGAE